MQFRLVISFILTLGLIFTFSQEISHVKTDPDLLREYLAADHDYHLSETTSNAQDQDRLTDLATEKLKKLATSEALANPGNDSLAFYIFFKLGVLQHSAGIYSNALHSYNNAIKKSQTTRAIPDSVLFKAMLYSGAMYYNLNVFDSALVRYKQAAAIADHYSNTLPEASRLYNSMGVLYYETGNYSQAKNDFSKAISTLPPSSPYYADLLINYKINLAQMYVKEEDYKEALHLYNEILSTGKNRQEIFHNLGIISTSLGDPKKALGYFDQIKYTDSKQIKLFNDKAQAYLLMAAYDSATGFLDSAFIENEKWNPQKKNVAHGTSYRIQGDLLSAKKQYAAASRSYQQAILQYDEYFTNNAIGANPGEYTGIFSYINLFNALNAKAAAFEKLFAETKDIVSLQNALKAYQSAFRLTEYVSRTYASDESRLFLEKIKYTVHSKPIDVCLQLFDLTGDKNYVAEAYEFDQLNKASVLSFSLQENALEQQAGISNDLLNKLTAARSAIMQYSLAATRTGDSIQLQAINDHIRDKEIDIARIREKINDDDKLNKLWPAERVPSVVQLQENLLDDETALLSYHLAGDHLVIFCIDAHHLNYVSEPLDTAFSKILASFLQTLQQVSDEKKYHGDSLSKILYKTLINPVMRYTATSKRLIIIPDDELNYLPFEALRGADNEYLLKNFAIIYQYSTALLGKEEPYPVPAQTLAMAPYTGTARLNGLQPLPYSAEEVKNLHGNILSGENATKENFLKNIGHYPIIHLATHAGVNDSLPMRSFISFYTDKKDSGEPGKLFAQEIYNLHLDSSRLVILSACETGSGKLVRGEGLMSLSRAFAYAGCPDIITSLWMAEDKTTAFITERLHYYLENHLSPDVALQKAKLDLLASNQISPALKTPNYWAHLVFIGNYQAEKKSYAWYWIAGVILLASGLVFYARKQANNKILAKPQSESGSKKK